MNGRQDAQSAQNRPGDVLSFGDIGEGDKHRGRLFLCRLDGQARFAHTAGAGNGEKPLFTQQMEQVLLLCLLPEAVRQVEWQWV